MSERIPPIYLDTDKPRPGVIWVVFLLFLAVTIYLALTVGVAVFAFSFLLFAALKGLLG
jgi:hypothetical protein